MKIDKLPFFVGVCNDINNFSFPIELEFDLFYDEELKMFRQKSNDKLNILLERVYLQGSLADGSLSSESGSVYIQRVIDYLENNFDFNKAKSILEIGVGHGEIISSLSKKYNEIQFTGIEPGNFNVKILDKKIHFINDFFPSNQLSSSYDLIYSFFVLEHIESPDLFLLEMKNKISSEGKIILAVPNCEPYVQTGDISMFIHEHFSYFTSESIIELVRNIGLYIENISIIEGAIFFTLSKNSKVKIVDIETFDYEIFEKKQEFFKDLFLEKINNFNESDIAIYNPIRALNFLSLLRKKNVRLVDDSSQLWGNFLPGLHRSVESFDEICANPPKLIIIFSRTFGERIRVKCRQREELRELEILILEDFI